MGMWVRPYNSLLMMTTTLLQFICCISLVFLCSGSKSTGTNREGMRVEGVNYNLSKIERARAKVIPGVLIFGDSIVDTGNNNGNTKSIARSNFPPYGRDFPGGIPTGRFSNGKVPSDFLAEELGIKELLPAYLDPNLQPNDLLTGVSFAVGGTGFDPLTAKIAAVTPLTDQLRNFEEYIGKLKGIVGEKRANFIVAKSLICVVACSNDIATTYFMTGARKSEYDIPSYTDFMLSYASDFLKQLYALGARRIGVFGAPPLGCLPSQRTLNGGIQRDCAETLNQASMLFNSKLSAQMDNLSKDLPNSRLVYVDIYNPFLHIIQNPTNYGFEIANKGCCGSGMLEVSKLCNQFSSGTCTDDSGYVFWDSFHPTERAYKIIVHQLLNKYYHRFV